MKTKSKALLMTLCAVLLVAASVLGTMAYLTSTTGEVKNTFSIGKINITLDEADVDKYGVAATPATRGTGNEYKLVPNHTYTKDPTVHVKGDSEDSYIFVKVVNGIEAIEAAGDTTIAAQIEKNWTKLDGVDNVYYQKYTKQNTDKDFVVFNSFTVKNDIIESTLETYQTASITITAYAVQQDGFADAKEAWSKTFGA